MVRFVPTVMASPLSVPPWAKLWHVAAESSKVLMAAGQGVLRKAPVS